MFRGLLLLLDEALVMLALANKKRLLKRAKKLICCIYLFWGIFKSYFMGIRQNYNFYNFVMSLNDAHRI